MTTRNPNQVKFLKSCSIGDLASVQRLYKRFGEKPYSLDHQHSSGLNTDDSDSENANDQHLHHHHHNTTNNNTGTINDVDRYGDDNDDDDDNSDLDHSNPISISTPILFHCHQALPLIQAVRSNNIELVKYLLNLGADPNQFNSDQDNALTVAVSTGRMIIIQLLIDYGAWLGDRDTFSQVLCSQSYSLVRNLIGDSKINNDHQNNNQSNSNIQDSNQNTHQNDSPNNQFQPHQSSPSSAAASPSPLSSYRGTNHIGFRHFIYGRDSYDEQHHYHDNFHHNYNPIPRPNLPPTSISTSTSNPNNNSQNNNNNSNNDNLTNTHIQTMDDNIYNVNDDDINTNMSQNNNKDEIHTHSANTNNNTNTNSANNNKVNRHSNHKTNSPPPQFPPISFLNASNFLRSRLFRSALYSCNSSRQIRDDIMTFIIKIPGMIQFINSTIQDIYPPSAPSPSSSSNNSSCSSGNGVNYRNTIISAIKYSKIEMLRIITQNGTGIHASYIRDILQTHHYHVNLLKISNSICEDNINDIKWLFYLLGTSTAIYSKIPLILSLLYPIHVTLSPLLYAISKGKYEIAQFLYQIQLKMAGGSGGDDNFTNYFDSFDLFDPSSLCSFSQTQHINNEGLYHNGTNDNIDNDGLLDHIDTRIKNHQNTQANKTQTTMNDDNNDPFFIQDDVDLGPTTQSLQSIQSPQFSPPPVLIPPPKKIFFQTNTTSPTNTLVLPHSNFTPLHLASISSRESNAMIEWLLEFDDIRPLLNETDCTGLTPLSIALIHGCIPTATSLLKHGATFNHPKEQLISILFRITTSSSNHILVSKTLNWIHKHFSIYLSMYINSYHNGFTPLLTAAAAHHPSIDIITILLHYGADITSTVISCSHYTNYYPTNPNQDGNSTNSTTTTTTTTNNNDGGYENGDVTFLVRCDWAKTGYHIPCSRSRALGIIGWNPFMLLVSNPLYDSYDKATVLCDLVVDHLFR